MTGVREVDRRIHFCNTNMCIVNVNAQINIGVKDIGTSSGALLMSHLSNTEDLYRYNNCHADSLTSCDVFKKTTVYGHVKS